MRKKLLKIVSFILTLLFVASVFVYKDFYKIQINKARGCYYVFQGDRAYRKGSSQEAVNYYQRALVLYPKHYKAWYNLANIFVSYENYAEALECYKKSLEINPYYINARIDKAIILSETTFDYDSAIEEYQTAIKLNPKWIYVPFVINDKNTYKHNKGVAFYNLGLAWRGKSLLEGEKSFSSREYLEKAAKAYEGALNTLKTYEAHYNLGIVNHLLGFENIAGLNYCKAIELAPLNYEAHYNLAILLRDMGQYIYSIEEFKKAGLILDNNADSNKTRYIYDVMNDVSRQMVAKGDYKILVEKLNEQSIENEKHLTYINGRVVLSDEFDKAMLNNFKNCSNKKFFEENNK